MLSPSGRRAARPGLAVVLAITAAACATGAPSDDGVAEGDPVAGRELFAANCAQCHGDQLQGTDRGPSFLDPVYEPGHHSDAAFQAAVARGVQPHHWDFGAMPPIEGLSPDEVADIVAHVRQQQEQAGY